jgi:UDP-GlcNAc:undecaprenyl-phosphate/decaprenyl-phosphate GlcNAc-1-phosphate transferase
MVLIFIVSFIATILACIILIKSEGLHSHFSYDHDLRGEQKFHLFPVPRIGGLAIIAGLVAGGYYFALRGPGTMQFMIGQG